MKRKIYGWIWQYLNSRIGGMEDNASFSFRKRMILLIKANILIQLLILLSGRGRIFTEYWGATRYMGTFNDPNQLAFFIFMMLLFGHLYMYEAKDRSYPVFYAAGLFIVLKTKSTGILLGIALFSLLVLIWFLIRVWKTGKIPVKYWLIGLAASALFIGFSLYVIWPPADFDVTLVDYNMLTRIQEKIWKLCHGGLGGMLLDRGADRLLQHPECLLYGAGEGGFDRYPYNGITNELHSSFFSVWFCYGILPAGLLLYWIGSKLRQTRSYQWCAVLALIAESFLLVNYRQPMFWMILLFAAAEKNRIALGREAK